MRTNSTVLIAAFLVFAGTPGLALAQGAVKHTATGKSAAPAAATSAPAPSASPSKEQMEDAAYQVHVLISAMESDKVEAPIKDALFECLYNNSFSKISDAIAKVIAQNPGKVAKRNPDQVLGVMAGICGFRPKDPAAGAAAPVKPAPAAPAKPGTQQQGR